jgi:uncharacterized membrane protein YkvA (DUF1232 family)
MHRKHCCPPPRKENDMSLDITLSIDEAGLAPFRAAWTRASHGGHAIDELASQARLHHAELDRCNVPGYVRGHLDLVPELADLLSDVAWQMDETARASLAGALAYFVDPADLIPDDHPRFGLLDDAIVLELALSEHLQEWLAWQEFAAMRVGFPDLGPMDRTRWLQLRRELPRLLGAKLGSYVDSRFAPADRRTRYRMLGDLPRMDMN